MEWNGIHLQQIVLLDTCLSPAWCCSSYVRETARVFWRSCRNAEKKNLLYLLESWAKLRHLLQKKEEINALRIADSSKQERITTLWLIVPKNTSNKKANNNYYYLLDLILFQLLFPKMINWKKKTKWFYSLKDCKLQAYQE